MRALASFFAGWAQWILLIVLLKSSLSLAFFLPENFPFDKTLSFCFVTDYQYESERSEEWDATNHQQTTVVRRSESLSFSQYDLVFQRSDENTPAEVPFGWHLGQRLHGDGHINTQVLEALQTSDAELHLSEGTQVLLVLVMTLMMIIEPDFPENSDFSSFLNQAQLHQMGAGWLNISVPHSAGGIEPDSNIDSGWPSIDIYIASNFSSSSLRSTSYDLIVNYEFWKDRVKNTKRFKLIVLRYLDCLYQAAKDMKWFRKDDDKDQDGPQGVRESGLCSFFKRLCGGCYGSEQEQLPSSVGETTPLVQKAQWLVNAQINVSDQISLKDLTILMFSFEGVKSF
ncbi:hypothetical protein [Endozoicomonas arenosclerae]|uniref:hypothetical protein n=1 Tax=Endozoicomonas arenosclerae TaxID=1633495 RepID=UPI000785ECB1|nr:hypothetical protein [Endozoicomonas arenosclerae]